MGEYRIEIVQTPAGLWTWIIHSDVAMYTAPATNARADAAESDALAYVYVKHPGIAFELERHPIDPA